jgi:hypothetical protein
MLSQIFSTIERQTKRGLRSVGLLPPPPRVRLTPIVLLRVTDSSSMRTAQLPLSFYAPHRELPMRG